ncbi:MAG: DUF2628 domain-containing protein [Hyphomicrobiaceae bacterium]
MIFGFAFRAWDSSRMVAYTVHEQPHPPMDRIDRAEELVFVKDGFVWSAAFFAPVWMIANGLWLVFLGYIASVVILSSVLSLFGLAGPIAGFAFLALHVLIGFEADTMKRWSLEQRGWSNVGMISGRNLQECERHFFEKWLQTQPVLRNDRTPTSDPQPPASTLSTVAQAEASVSSRPTKSRRNWFWPFGAQKA